MFLDQSAVPDVDVRSVVQDPEDDTLVQVVAAIMEAEEEYRPTNSRYPGKITLFWADDAAADIDDNRLGWARLAAGGCDIHVVPGTHTSMREEPHVQRLVEKLQPCLEKAQLLAL